MDTQFIACGSVAVTADIHSLDLLRVRRMMATLEELEPMVCSSYLRQVSPCQSVDARIVGDEAIKCQRTAAKRNLDAVRLSPIWTFAKGG